MKKEKYNKKLKVCELSKQDFQKWLTTLKSLYFDIVPNHLLEKVKRDIVDNNLNKINHITIEKISSVCVKNNIDKCYVPSIYGRLCPNFLWLSQLDEKNMIEILENIIAIWKIKSEYDVFFELFLPINFVMKQLLLKIGRNDLAFSATIKRKGLNEYFYNRVWTYVASCIDL